MSPVRIGEAVEAFLRMRSSRCSPVTMKNDALVLRRFVASLPSDIQVRHLQPHHVEEWFYGEHGLTSPHRTRDGRKRPPIEASTHNYYRNRLKSFLDYCSRRGLLRNDLLAEVAPLPVPKRVRLQPNAEVLLRMLYTAPNARDRALLATAINTGARAGELAALQVGDVDLHRLSLRLWVSKSKTEDDMPITHDLDRELRVWLTTYAAAMQRPLEREDYLFPASTGPRYRWDTDSQGQRHCSQVAAVWDPKRPMTKLHRVAQDALARVGLPTKHEGIHTLRRAVARHYYDTLAGEGHDAAIRDVQALLHHANSQTTEHYLGISRERESRDRRLRGHSLFQTDTHLANVVELPLAGGG